MGPTVAEASKLDWEEMAAACGAIPLQGLSVMGTRGKYAYARQHLMGHLKNHLSSEIRQELLSLIEDYRQGLVPLIVPLA